MPDRNPSPSRSAWSPALWLTLLLLVAGFAGLRTLTPTPAEADAPATSFSATRAAAMLARIVGDGSPHGVGTPANAAVRERIVTELEALGLEVERFAAFACRGLVCAPVINLIAEVPGSHPGEPVVLLTSHYDSVHAGPGVADDLHGVATSIETARALLAGDPPQHPVRLLIDEGEEVGLLGAKAFVQQHPRAAEVAVVINIEARGTRGLSAMFETSAGNGALVEAYLAEAPHPQATSLAIEVYRRMPNDTDLSVFTEAGHAGLNFAFVGGVGHYHTPLDDLRHLDLGSVQHQGDNVLASARALASGPLPVPVTDDAIYADVLGLFVISWPARWGTGVAMTMLALLLGLLVAAQKRGRVGLMRVGLGFAAVLGGSLLILATSFLLAMLVSAVQGEPVPAHAHPFPFRLALWLVSTSIAWALARGLGRWARPLELAYGIWITWSLAALALAVYVPGASVALCIPVGAAVLGLAWATFWEPREASGIAVAAVLMIALWTILALGLEDAFGFALTPAVAAAIAVALSAVMPGLGSRTPESTWLHRGLGLAALAATVAACVVPIHDADYPRRIALTHYDDRSQDQATTVAIGVDRLPAALLEALGTDEIEPGVLPWTAREGALGPGVAGNDPAPTLEVLDSTPTAPTTVSRRVRARLSSPRGADRAVLLLSHPGLTEVRVEGHPVATAADRAHRLMIFGLPSAGVELTLELEGSDPVEATVIDCVAGLPESTAAIVAARDADAVTIQWGDIGCIGSHASL